MRLTNRNARVDRDGLHNDRNFDLETAIHIDQNKVSGNKYTTYIGENYNNSFKNIELNFYEREFEEYITMYNQKNRSKHSDRLMTAEDYYKKKYSQPEDKVIQVGNIDEHIDSDELWDCAKQFMNEFNEKFGDHCMILDMALHVDESTPHIHIRRVWIAKDENDISYVNQTKALEQMGIERPNPEKEVGRSNNAKITFTKMENEMLREICRQQGIELEEKRAYGKQRHLSIKAFKEEKEAIKNEYDREIERLKEEKKKINKDVEDLKEEVNDYMDMWIQNAALASYQDELKAVKKRGLKEFDKTLHDILEYDFSLYDAFAKGEITREELNVQLHINREIRMRNSFISEQGLTDEFEKYKEKVIREEEFTQI